MRGSGILLRIASGLAFLQGLAHAYAIATYVPHHGPAELAVVSAMRTQFFHFGGPWAHSYWELYSGYGWLAAVQCFVEATALWIAAAWSEKVNTTPLVWLFIVSNLVHAALVLHFFFLTPLYPDLIVTACLFGNLVQRQGRRDGDRAAIPHVSR
jgi:hypothetical protein